MQCQLAWRISENLWARRAVSIVNRVVDIDAKEHLRTSFSPDQPDIIENIDRDFVIGIGDALEIEGRSANTVKRIWKIGGSK